MLETPRSAALRRSCLITPASNPRLLARARTIAADEVVIDLEDTVTVDRKDDARRAAVAALAAAGWRARSRAVRINGVMTPWCLDDLLALAGAAGPQVDAVVVPKVEDPAEVQFVARVLEQLETRHRRPEWIRIEVQIESPRGLVEVEHIAAASPRLNALVFGPGDYAAASGMRELTIGGRAAPGDGDVWHYPLARLVTAAHAFGLQAIDGPYGVLADFDGLRVSARRSRALGFDGKWAIHPDQIAICEEVYVPTADELARAERLLATCDADRTGAAARLDGEMVDAASRRLALATLARMPAAIRGDAT